MISGKISGVIFFLAKKPTFDQCTGLSYPLHNSTKPKISIEITPLSIMVWNQIEVKHRQTKQEKY